MRFLTYSEYIHPPLKSQIVNSRSARAGYLTTIGTPFRDPSCVADEKGDLSVGRIQRKWKVMFDVGFLNQKPNFQIKGRMK